MTEYFIMYKGQWYDELTKVAFQQLDFKTNDDVAIVKNPTKKVYSKDDELPKEEELPILNRNDLKIEPTIAKLYWMKRVELQNVRGLKFYNENGSIEYPEPTDLINVNIDKLVFILPKQAEVYPDDKDKPEVGQKLNKWAIITLKNVNSTEDKLKQKLS